MGRAPCCDKMGLKKGPWTPDEDRILVAFIRDHGHGNWRALPKQAGLLRCGKSCRLRWTNYLRPDIKRGNFSTEEENTIMELHNKLGNRWSIIASHLPGRTDNEIKNYWNTHLKKRLPEHMVNTKTASKKRSKQVLMKQSMVDASSDFPSYPFRQDASTVSSSETKGNQASDAWFENLSSFESRLSGSSSCSDFSMESEASLGISSSSSSAFMNETAVPSELFAEGDDISLHSISNLQTLDFFSVEANPVCDFPALQGIDEIKPEFRQEEDNSGFEDLLKSDSEGVDFWRQVLREVDVANAFPSFE